MVGVLFCVAIPLDFIPVAAREIGHGYRHAAVGDRGSRQFAEARPFGGVVNVLVEGQAVLQAVNKAVVHNEVHAAVTAYFLGFLLNLYGDGVEVLLQDLVAHLGWYKTMRIKMLSFGQETFG